MCLLSHSVAQKGEVIYEGAELELEGKQAHSLAPGSHGSPSLRDPARVAPNC